MHKRCDIRNYLDQSIDFWRNARDTAQTEPDKTMAIHYVDAFQSVRITIFDEPHAEALESQ